MSLFDRVKNNAMEAYQRQFDEYDMYRKGDINAGQYLLRSAGNFLGGTAGNVIGEATSAVIPDYVENKIGEGAQYLMNTSGGQKVQGMLQENPELARDLGAALQVAESLPFVRGVSTASKAGKAVDAMTGPESGRGMALASANNVIPGYYGPQKAGAVATWLPNQAYNITKDMLSPKSRATYREQGITNTQQRIIGRALADEAIEEGMDYAKIYKYFGFDPKEGGTHRAEASAQYMDRIHGGSGRKGNRNLIDQAMKKSDLVDYTSWTKGTYPDLIKRNKLKPYPMITEDIKGKRPVSIPDDDLQFIEDHFAKAWTEPSSIPFRPEVPFSKAQSPIIAIKSPGKGGSTTGKHFKDVLHDAPYVRTVNQMFPKGVTEVDPKELRKTLEAASLASQELANKYRFDVLDRKTKDGSVWVTGSRPGSAITEGGINYLAKVSPKGTVMGVMSDEHNLFEGIAGKVQKYTASGVPALSAMRYLLPNRFIAVTPPMMTDLKKGVKYIERDSFDLPAGRTGMSAKERLEPIRDYQPSEGVLTQERLRSRGQAEAATGAGLMSIGAGEEDY